MPKKNKEKNKRKKEKNTPFLYLPLPFVKQEFVHEEHLDPTKPLHPLFQAHADKMGLSDYDYRYMFNMPTIPVIPKDIRYIHPDIVIEWQDGTEIMPGKGEWSEDFQSVVTFKNGKITAIKLKNI